MSLIASPSRGIQSAHSTALGESSEQDLTNHQTQEKFRGYISRRIAAHCQRFPALTLGDVARKIVVPGEAVEEADAKRREEIEMARVSLEEILLLVRKLREGVMASHRMDAATIEGECKIRTRRSAAFHTQHRTDAAYFVPSLSPYRPQSTSCRCSSLCTPSIPDNSRPPSIVSY